ncbi:MAG TPA: ABC-2 family transporter protein [Anaerolineales bacterium]|nr:ABC-2 family transporter protein [Anaerolineales bacterium]
MRLFLEIFIRSVRRQMTYRATILAGLATNYIFGLFRIAILLALYGDRQSVAGVDIDGAVTYMVLIQALIGFLSMFSWFDLMQSVYTGEVSGDLLKPISLYTLWMARDLGRAAVQFVFRGLLIFALYLPFFDLAYPAGAGQWLGLAIVIVLGWAVSFSWRFLVNLFAFWSPNALGIGRFLFILSWFFSGFLMPLRYYPDWVVEIANLTPFPYMMNVVLDVFIGVLTGPDLFAVVMVQLAWIAALGLAGQVVLRAGVRRLVILGG